MAIEIPGQHFVGEVGQKAIIEKDGKVLMCSSHTFVGWDLPGGRVHKNEGSIEALEREIKEELGIDIEVERPLYTFSSIKEFKDDSPYYVIFKANLKNPEQEFMLAEDEITGIRWVEQKEVASLVGVLDEWKEALTSYFEDKNNF